MYVMGQSYTEKNCKKMLAVREKCVIYKAWEKLRILQRQNFYLENATGIAVGEDQLISGIFHFLFSSCNVSFRKNDDRHFICKDCTGGYESFVQETMLFCFVV